MRKSFLSLFLGVALVMGFVLTPVHVLAIPIALPEYVAINGHDISDLKFDLDLSNIPELPEITHHSGPGDWEVGDITFWVSLDTFLGFFFFALFELRAVGTFGEIWVQVDLDWLDSDPRATPVITDAQAEHMVNEFDTIIYPREVEFFGEPDFLDGSGSFIGSAFFGDPDFYKRTDGKTVILVSNIRDLNYYDPTFPFYIAGFYTGTFEFFFNRNVMSIDAFEWANRVGPNAAPWREPDSSRWRPFLYEGVFAHEYQHLIHDDFDPDEDSWVNEGVSMFAEWLTYFFAWGTANFFQATPDNSLTEWEDQGAINILADYGGAAFFFQYSFDKFGARFIQEVVRQEANGIEGYNDALERIRFLEMLERGGEVEFEFDLSGDQEVPPVSTDASGEAEVELEIKKHGQRVELEVELDVCDIEDVFASHIHGPAGPGENAGILLGIFDGPLFSTDDDDCGELVDREWGQEDLEAELSVSLEDFVMYLATGQTYINVHTDANPAGEIRGQVVGDDDDDDDDEEPAPSFRQVFYDWTVANLIGSEGVKRQGLARQIGYESIDLNPATNPESIPFRTYDVSGPWIPWTSGCDFTTTITLLGSDTGICGVGSWGTDYIQLHDLREESTLFFDGDDFVEVGWFTEDMGADGDEDFEWHHPAGNLADFSLVGELDLTGLGSATLTFDTYFDIEPFWDFGFVQVSEDGGATWTSLSNADTTTDHESQAHPDIVAQLPGFTGFSGGWVTESFDLSAFVGGTILLQFRYMTDWAFQLPGWWVDDIKLNGILLDDAGDTVTLFEPVFPEVDWRVSIVVLEGKPGRMRLKSIRTMRLDDATETGTLRIDADDGEVFLIISPDQGPADYRFRLEPT